LYVIDANLVRRQLNTWQKANLVSNKIKLLDEIEQTVTKRKKEEEQEENFEGKFTFETKEEGGEEQHKKKKFKYRLPRKWGEKKVPLKDTLCKEVGLSRKTVDMSEFIEEHADAEQIKKLDEGKASVFEIFNQIEKEIKRNDLIKAAAATNTNLLEGVKRLHGDFTEDSGC
jgi:hypothetical protein